MSDHIKMNSEPMRDAPLCIECYTYGAVASGVVLVQGPPGSGKTTLLNAFMRIATQNGRSILFFSTQSDPAQIRELTGQWGATPGQFELIDCYAISRGPNSSMLVTQKMNLPRVGEELSKRLETVENPYVAFDSIDHFVVDAGEDEALKFVVGCSRALTLRSVVGCTTVTSGVHSEVFESRVRAFFQGVIELKMLESGDKFERFLRIRNLRGSSHPTEWYPFEITNEGILIGTKKYRSQLPPRHTEPHFFNFNAETSGHLEVAERPNLSWDDLGGMDEVKRVLKEAVEYPLTHPELYQKYQVKPLKGILFYGPPGTGKTFIARVVASVARANFVSIGSPDLLSGLAGEPEKRIRDLFKWGRENSPAVLFFDEIDSITPKRNSAGLSDSAHRIVAQFLIEMDGLFPNSSVLVVAATNHPELIDPALLRPGRFDKLIYISPPDRDARLKILQKTLSGMQIAAEVDLAQIAESTEWYSTADINALVNEAAGQLLRSEISGAPRNQLSMSDFDHALKVVRPSMASELLSRYASFASLRRESD